jgi:hypothetical protein
MAPQRAFRQPFEIRSRGVCTAEEFEATHCYGGTYTAFQGSQELKAILSFVHNGSLRGPNTKFNNVATHCAGTQREAGPTAERLRALQDRRCRR